MIVLMLLAATIGAVVGWTAHGTVSERAEFAAQATRDADWDARWLR